MGTDQLHDIKVRETTVRVKGHEYACFVVGFVVDFGDVDGRRVRKSYKNRKIAERAVETWRAERKILSKKLGDSAKRFLDGDVQDAAAALQILGAKSTLTEAAMKRTGLPYIQDASGPDEGHTHLSPEEVVRRQMVFIACKEEAVRDFVAILNSASLSKGVEELLVGLSLLQRAQIGVPSRMRIWYRFRHCVSARRQGSGSAPTYRRGSPMKPSIVTLRNSHGMTLKVSSMGGTAIALTAPDRDGKMDDILLGFDKPSAEAASAYIGTLIGRVCNRIAKGRFTLDGETYCLARNIEPAGRPCTLHGGAVGFDRRDWDMRVFDAKDGPAVELTYLSPEGEEDFPGNLFTRVVYTLTDDDAWRIEYWAMTDAPTPVNLTQHAYFNLTGCKRDILAHELQLFCDHYTPTDKGFIPTGEIAPVAGTPLDFTTPTPIGKRIDAKFRPMTVVGGYDNNFVIRRKRNQAKSLVRSARLRDPDSGRVMETWTTEPCVLLYSGNFLDGTLVGKRKVVYGKRFGLCLETQHAPDSPNQPAFPSIILRPGEVYQQTTEYRFSAE